MHSDTWVSMGQDDEKAQRLQAFEGFTVDDSLMASAAPECDLHALPARLPRAGGHRQRDRRAAQPGVPPGPQPPPRGARRARLPRRGRDREREAAPPAGDRPPDRAAAGRQPAAPARAARPRGRADHPGDGVARSRRARRDQGARRRRPDGVRPAGDRDRSDRPVRAAPPGARGVGRRRRRVGQHRRRAHAAGMRPRRRLGPRPQRDRRAARHGRRRRHDDVRRRGGHRRRAARPPTCASWPASTTGASAMEPASHALWHGRFERPPGGRLDGVHRQPRRSIGGCGATTSPARVRTCAGSPPSACSTRRSAMRCSPPSTRSSAEMASGRLRVRRVRRGHPHGGRTAGHRARRCGRRQAAHGPEPQRPGGHRPAAVVQA